MAILVNGSSSTAAWSNALAWLVNEPKGKAVHLNVSFPANASIDSAVIDAVNALLPAGRKVRVSGKEVQDVTAVANTIFPQSLYVPGRGAGSRAHLYELNSLSMELTRRRGTGERDTYFNRMVAYPTKDGETFNQLEFLVDRIERQLRKPGGKSSAYELGLSCPSDAEIRIQQPGLDKQPMGFPCLSHISLTVCDGRVNLAAIYRNHSYISRALGNFIGLSRLAQFVATECGIEAGEVLCASTHADAEISEYTKTRVKALASALVGA